MLEGRHYQNAYVTRDIAAAIARFRETADVRLVIEHDASIDVTTPTGLRPMHNRIAFIWVDNLQYELIEPVDGAVEFYREALPADGETIRFHHICMRVDDWDDFRARVDRQPWPIVIEGQAGPLRFLYLDARAWLGHYVEYTWMPDEVWRGSGGE